MVIKLPTGQLAIIDDADAPLVAPYHWHAQSHGRTIYAIATAHSTQRHPDGRRKRPTVLMHRLISPPPPGLEIDHANGDGLDNTRANLRHVTRSQNAANRRKAQTASAPYKGITHQHGNRRKPWAARIGVNGARLFLGHYATAEAAARAYDQAARTHYGQFARTNF